MARIRYLKPDFFKDEDLKNLSYEARLFYQGLWCQADREGRGEDRPERLKAEIFPYDDNIDAEKIMQALANCKLSTAKPFIIRFGVDGERYFQIVKWHKHQRPHHTEINSVIPPPPFLTDTTPLKHGESPMEKGMEKGMEKEYSARFNEVWSKYPNKLGRKQAERHYQASVKTFEDFTLINTALANYLASERVARGFVQNGSTWFNNWRDWIEYTETMCDKCKNTGHFINKRGYKQSCECPKGKLLEKEDNPRL